MSNDELSHKLCGAWTLSAWISTDSDGKQHSPFGVDALGSLHYALDARRGGVMSAQLSARSRPAISSTEASDARALAKCAAFDSYVAYCGRWRVEGDRVIHYVESSLFPNWVGTELTRVVRFHEDVLILSTVPQAPGSATHELSWRRA